MRTNRHESLRSVYLSHTESIEITESMLRYHSHNYPDGKHKQNFCGFCVRTQKHPCLSLGFMEIETYIFAVIWK